MYALKPYKPVVSGKQAHDRHLFMLWVINSIEFEKPVFAASGCTVFLHVFQA
jgi:hypothetical protein